MRMKGVRGLAVIGLVLVLASVLVAGCTFFQPQWDWGAPLSKLELAWDSAVAARQWAQELLYALWDRDQDRAISAAEMVAEFTGRALRLLDEAFAKFEAQGERIYKRERDAYDLIGEAAQENSKIMTHLNTAPSPDWVWLIEQAKQVLDQLEEADTELEKAIKDRSAR